MILRIALRYLLAKKSHRVINVISAVAVAGVAIATAAIVVVLSVFNGFTDLAARQLSAIDPDLKATPVQGKVFAGADSLCALIDLVPGVAASSPVLEERALLVARDAQKPVIAKGVSPRIADVIDLDRIMLDGGIYAPESGLPGDTVAGIQPGVGVAVTMGLRPSPYPQADIYMPRRLGRINPANPAAAYRQLPVAVTGIFRVDQPDYDSEHILVPLDAMRRMLEYTSAEATALEIKVQPGYDITAVRATVESALGNGFEVLERERQQAETFRMIAVEKWVTFLMLVFILVIASFNIVSTLSLIVIEKRDDMATLRALGATHATVAGIFAAQGWLITAAGGIAGALLGVILSLLQQHFGLIKLGADPTALTIDVYPVVLQWADVAAVVAAVAVVGGIIALISRIFTKKIQ